MVLAGLCDKDVPRSLSAEKSSDVTIAAVASKTITWSILAPHSNRFGPPFALTVAIIALMSLLNSNKKLEDTPPVVMFIGRGLH